MERKIRQSTLADLDAIYGIWEEGLKVSLGTQLPEDLDKREYFARQIREQDDDFKTFVVENDDGKIVAWASLVPFRANPVTRNTMAELSTYVGAASTHQNVARDLLLHTLRHADKSKLQFVVAYIAVTNERTIQIAQRGGFMMVGVIPQMARVPAGPQLAYLAYPAGSWALDS